MRIDVALAGISRLEVDTAPFIYFAEQDLKFRDRVREVFRFTEENKIALVTSTVTLTEVLVKPLRTGDKSVEGTYRALLSDTKFVQLIPVDEAIANRAAHLRATYNLRTPDALQAATAIESGAGAFLTNDLGVKRVTEIRVLVLDELEIDPTP